MVVMLSALHASHALLLRKILGATVQLEGFDKLKKCNDFIGNRNQWFFVL
jgi:hypothetical protein